MAAQPGIGSVERAVGFAGRFLVLYVRDGRAYWDAVYSPTEEQAREDFLGMASEMGWDVSDVRVKPREPGAAA